jgi:hypothetical protein
MSQPPAPPVLPLFGHKTKTLLTPAVPSAPKGSLVSGMISKLDQSMEVTEFISKVSMNEFSPAHFFFYGSLMDTEVLPYVLDILGRPTTQNDSLFPG